MTFRGAAPDEPRTSQTMTPASAKKDIRSEQCTEFDGTHTPSLALGLLNAARQSRRVDVAIVSVPRGETGLADDELVQVDASGGNLKQRRAGPVAASRVEEVVTCGVLGGAL